MLPILPILPILYVVGEKVKNDEIVKAKKRGAERAANLFRPVLVKMQEKSAKMDCLYNKSETELSFELDKLVAELDKLNTIRDRKRDLFEEIGGAGLVYITGGVLCCFAAKDLVFWHDFDEDEKLQFNEECKVWQKRIEDERRNLKRKQIKIDRFKEDGEELKAFFLSEINKLNLEIAELDFKIAIMKEIEG